MRTTGGTVSAYGGKVQARVGADNRYLDLVQCSHVRYDVRP